MVSTEAVTTAHELRSSSPPCNGARNGDAAVPPKRARRSKYRHIAAYHSELRHSSLSRDSAESPNFLGFRNLMVLVLGMVVDHAGEARRLTRSDSGYESKIDH